MNSTEIQTEIESWNAKVAAIVAKAEAASGAVDLLERERGAFVLDASLDNATAQERLDELERRQAKATRKEKDLAAAVEQGQQKISSLQAELAEAQRQEAAGEISELVARQLELCAETEECTKLLVEILQEGDQIARQIQSRIVPLDGDLETFLGPRKRTIQFIFSRIRQFSPGGWEPGGTWKFEGGLTDVTRSFWRGISRRLNMQLVAEDEKPEVNANEAA